MNRLFDIFGQRYFIIEMLKNAPVIKVPLPRLVPILERMVLMSSSAI